MLEFNPVLLVLLNGLIALMTFGAALSVHPGDFAQILRAPRAPAIGLGAQFLLLPALTGLFTTWAGVPADLALGMILVASCPGGNFSNILTWLARGDVAVSVSMTAISSFAATLLTPLNFAFWAWFNPATRELAAAISLNTGDLLALVLAVLALPMILGMVTAYNRPALAAWLERPMRIGSVAVLTVFVGLGFAAHADTLVAEFHRIVWLAATHNTAALVLGAAAAALAGLPAAARRAVTFEVGVQNTGLGLLIAFNFFPGLAGALLMIAFWGVPHLVSGLGLVWWWSRRPLAGR